MGIKLQKQWLIYVKSHIVATKIKVATIWDLYERIVCIIQDGIF